MVDAGGGIALYGISGVGVCLYCGHEHNFATFDSIPLFGSVVFCGACCGVHLLSGEIDAAGDWQPTLEKPTPAERLELLGRPEVRMVRDAYQLDQMEARMTRSSSKDKRPPAPRVAGKVRLGRNRLEARGPDA